ncbi:MAG: HlyD family type I secretion periplasmic adaptor subunit [Alsobacter sp.]
MSGTKRLELAVAPVAPSDWQDLVRRSWIIVAVVFGLGGLWSVVARLDAGAIAPGVVAVETSRKTIQHFEGGIVREILARDGDAVQAGDVLIRLDDTQARAGVEVLRKQLAATLVEESRLVAERDEAADVSFPPEVVSERQDPLVARAIADQLSQFRERRANLEGQKSIFSARIAQVSEEMTGTRREKEAAEEQIATIRQELEGLRMLLAKNLVQLPRVLSLEREQSRLKGTVGRAIADLAKAEQTIGEARLQIQQIRQQFLEGVSRDLPATRKTIAEIREKLRVQLDILQRVDIVAPEAGVVQGSKVFTVGGVVRPGDTILEIVPVSDQLVIRAQVSPLDVDNVHENDAAEIRFPAFTLSRPPLFFGKVKRLSRDRLVDDSSANKQPYFAAEVAVDYDTIPVEYRRKLVAGMAADVIVATGERTALQYIVGPVMARIRAGMHEN